MIEVQDSVCLFMISGVFFLMTRTESGSQMVHDGRWVLGKALLMESMVVVDIQVTKVWQDISGANDSPFSPTSETDGNGQQRPEHGVERSGQRSGSALSAQSEFRVVLALGLIVVWNCLRVHRWSQVSRKWVLSENRVAHSIPLLNNPIGSNEIYRFLMVKSPPFWARPKTVISVIESAPRNPEIWGVLAQVRLSSRWQARTTKQGVPIAWAVS